MAPRMCNIKLARSMRKSLVILRDCLVRSPARQPLDGQGASGSLAFDKAGNLYGVTAYGGINDVGSVFELTNSNGKWTESVIYSFKFNGVDGYYPYAGVTLDSAGNIFGTTVNGGLISVQTVVLAQYSSSVKPKEAGLNEWSTTFARCPTAMMVLIHFLVH